MAGAEHDDGVLLKFIQILHSVDRILSLSVIRDDETHEFMSGLSRILARAHARGLSARQLIMRLEEASSVAVQAEAADHGVVANPADVQRMSLDDIARVLDDPNTTRKTLIDISMYRFGSSAGKISRYSRENLVEHVRALIQNERVHETIARLASKDPTKAA